MLHSMKLAAKILSQWNCHWHLMLLFNLYTWFRLLEMPRPNTTTTVAGLENFYASIFMKVAFCQGKCDPKKWF